MACVLVATLRPIHAEAQLVHVALLDIIQRVLERAICLLAFSVPQHGATDRHTSHIKLVQKAALVALHA